MRTLFAWGTLGNETSQGFPAVSGPRNLRNTDAWRRIWGLCRWYHSLWDS